MALSEDGNSLYSVVDVSRVRGENIHGIALFRDHLYVAGYSDIEVYHLSTLSFQRNLPVAGLRCVSDMTSCPDRNVLFIVDDRNKMIHVVDERGLAVKSKSDGKANALSVNSQLKV